MHFKCGSEKIFDDGLDRGYKREKLRMISKQVGEWCCHYGERTSWKKEHGGAASLGTLEANRKIRNCISGVTYRNLSEKQSAYFLRQS